MFRLPLGLGEGFDAVGGIFELLSGLQILTIAELLAGKKVEFPTHRVETFAKAERKTKSQQDGLF